MYAKVNYIDENGELLNPSFKKEWRYKTIELITEKNLNYVTSTRIVKLIERKPKQLNLFD